MDTNQKIKANKEKVKQIIKSNFGNPEYYEKIFDKCLNEFNCRVGVCLKNQLINPVNIYFDTENLTYFVSAMNSVYVENFRPEILLVKTSKYITE